MISNAASPAIEAALDLYGIDDPARRRRIRNEAQRRLEERATKAIVRTLARDALQQGWRPPPSCTDVYESAGNFPVPPQDVYQRVLRWVREAPDFSIRELMRASNFFEKACDARAVVEGLLSKGEIEALEPPLRWPGDVGRHPGPRYRAVRGHVVDIKRPASSAARDDLDWSFLDATDPTDLLA